MATPRTGRPRGRPKGSTSGRAKPRTTGNPTGRPKGAISKSTRAILEAAAAKSITPLECILQNMRRHLRARRWAEAERSAALAAPYCHPRLAAATVQVKRSLAQQIAEMTDEELAAHIEEMKQMTGLSDDDIKDELATLKTKGNA